MHSQWQLPVETKSRRKINDISSDPPHPFRCIRCSLLIIVSDSIRFASAFYRVFLDVSSTHRRNIHLFYFLRKQFTSTPAIVFHARFFGSIECITKVTLAENIFTFILLHRNLYALGFALTCHERVCMCRSTWCCAHKSTWMCHNSPWWCMRFRGSSNKFKQRNDQHDVLAQCHCFSN